MQLAVHNLGITYDVALRATKDARRNITENTCKQLWKQ